MRELLGLGFMLLSFVLFGIPLVFWGFSIAESITTPDGASNRKQPNQMSFPEYEYQLYREKEKKRSSLLKRFSRT